jgi:hypothetical protein
VYQVESVGLHGKRGFFEKPMMMTLIMFAAMVLAFPLHYVDHYYRVWQWRRANANLSSQQEPLTSIKSSDSSQNNSTSATAPLLGRGGSSRQQATPDLHTTPPSSSVDAPLPEPKHPSWGSFCLLLVPAVFDLAATALASIGLLYVTVSLYQLSKCCVIIVTALLRVLCLKQRLRGFEWTGIGVNVIAMLLVGSSAFVDAPDADSDDGTVRDPRIGVLFILLSCSVQGAQYVFEEALMDDLDIPPLFIVGGEGFWGTLLMAVVVMPWAYLLPGTDHGSMESTWDAVAMLQHSVELRWIVIAYAAVIFFYNVFCVYITFLLDSIWHAILDNFRPISVWSVDLLLFHFTAGRFGEVWSQGDWMQLAGMMVLFLGTAVYSRRVIVPGLFYPPVLDADELVDGLVFLSSPRVATPMMRKLSRRSAGAPFMLDGGSSPLVSLSGNSCGGDGVRGYGSAGQADRTLDSLRTRFDSN